MNENEIQRKIHPEIQYETKELGPPICDSEEKIEIDKLILNECFFSEVDSDNEEINNNDNLIAQHIDYFENYNIKMLQHIASYYEIPKRRLKKEELIELIIQFENEPENSLRVYNRKRYWHYIHELKNDSYFGKFVLFQ
jgi:hypothetical protein